MTGLRIASDPPDAEVFLDGKPAGLTIGGVLVLNNLKPGQVSVLVRKEGYADALIKPVLVPGKVLDRRVVLAGKPASLQLTELTSAPGVATLIVNSLPPDAEVLIDGAEAGRTPTPVLKVPLSASNRSPNESLAVESG